MRRRLVTLVLLSLMFTSTVVSVQGDVGRNVMDNWEDGDAWVEISLILWVANQTEEWDSSGGLPDPQFRICFDVDGQNLECVNTPTWENQWELNATWNYTIDIPDTSNLLNITIECEDNDAFNDDECDMNADINEWKLYAEYNWSQNPNMTISGNGDGDGNGTWKNAASVWEVKVFGFGDEDGDGVPDNIDTCPNTTESFGNVNQTVFPGCSWGQLDFDADGVPNSIDLAIYNAGISTQPTHSSTASDWLDTDRISYLSTGSSGSSSNFPHPIIIHDKTDDKPFIQWGGKVWDTASLLANEPTTISEFPARCWGSIESIQCSPNIQQRQYIDFNHDGFADSIGPSGDGISLHTTMLDFPPTIETPGFEYNELFEFQFTIGYIQDPFFEWNIEGDCGNHPLYSSNYAIWDTGSVMDVNGDGLLDIWFTDPSINSGCESPRVYTFPPESFELIETNPNQEPVVVPLFDMLNGSDCAFNSAQNEQTSNAWSELSVAKGHSPLSEFEKNSGYNVIVCAMSTFDGIRTKFMRTHLGSIVDEEIFLTPYVDGKYPYMYDGLGGLGDINGDGWVDYLRSPTTNECFVFLGSNSGVNSASGIKIGDFDCNSGLNILDINGDGTVDLSGDHVLAFNNDDGTWDVQSKESSPSTLFWGPHAIADIDGDGDLDRLVDTSSAGKLTIFYNPSIVDNDEDTIEDQFDDCPETPSGDTVDENGCGLTQRDTDTDGINDATDQCPSTPVGYPVNLEGCAPSQLDSDSDGINDGLDVCPTTPNGESVDLNGCSQSEIDTDNDGVVNSNDACPGTAQGSVVDVNGCSESDVVDNDADGDGVVDTYDACPSTTVGSTVDQNGCSDAQLDLDGDGVPNTRDQCPETQTDAEVSYYGCSASQGDEDLDGVMNADDDCPGSWFVDKNNPPETSNGCDGMLESQDDDDDGDGLVNAYDECPNTPAGQSVDNQGCTIAQRNAVADDTSSSGTIGDAIIGFLCCFGILGIVLSYSSRFVKKSSPSPKLVKAPQQVIHQQSVHQQQQVMRELENQRKKAEHQVAQLQQQLHQSNQMSASQLASVQSQLRNMQQQVTATNMAKADMQRELEQLKAQEMERNTLTGSPVKIQDSAVAGDSLVGSTKIENQTVNDADAIARAAAAAAIDAYRMGLNDRER
jgi:hypothetical protein